MYGYQQKKKPKILARNWRCQNKQIEKFIYQGRVLTDPEMMSHRNHVGIANDAVQKLTTKQILKNGTLQVKKRLIIIRHFQSELTFAKLTEK